MVGAGSGRRKRAKIFSDAFPLLHLVVFALDEEEEKEEMAVEVFAKVNQPPFPSPLPPYGR